MSCSCNCTSTTTTSVKRFFTGDTLLVNIYNGTIPEPLVISATSTVSAIIKNLDLGTSSTVAITDLTNGNNFAAGIVKLVSNVAYLAGNYKILIKSVNGANTQTVDTAIYFTYETI